MPRRNDPVMLEVEVDPSTLLATDTPMVVFLTDLETAVGGGASSGSGGGDAGGSVGSGDPQGAVLYCAICQRQDHESLGFVGTWVSMDHVDIVNAMADQGAHEHPEASVMMRLGQYLVGPVTQR